MHTLTLLALALALHALSVSAQTVYVAANGTDAAGGGASVATALRTLPYALSSAGATDVVLVGYVGGGAVASRDVSIAAYAGIESGIDCGGASGVRALTVASGARASLAGITVRGCVGSAFGGAVLVAPNASLGARGVRFADNAATVAGGAVFANASADVDVAACTFIGNRVDTAVGAQQSAAWRVPYDAVHAIAAAGGAMAIVGARGKVSLADCMFANNSAALAVAAAGAQPGTLAVAGGAVAVIVPAHTSVNVSGLVLANNTANGASASAFGGGAAVVLAGNASAAEVGSFVARGNTVATASVDVAVARAVGGGLFVGVASGVAGARCTLSGAVANNNTASARVAGANTVLASQAAGGGVGIDVADGAHDSCVAVLDTVLAHGNRAVMADASVLWDGTVSAPAVPVVLSAHGGGVSYDACWRASGACTGHVLGMNGSVLDANAAAATNNTITLVNGLSAAVIASGGGYSASVGALLHGAACVWNVSVDVGHVFAQSCSATAANNVAQNTGTTGTTGATLPSAYATVAASGGGTAVAVASFGIASASSAGAGAVSFSVSHESTWIACNVSAVGNVASVALTANDVSVVGSAHATVLASGGGSSATAALALLALNGGAAHVADVTVATGERASCNECGVAATGNVVTAASFASEVSNAAVSGSAYASVVSGGGGAGVHIGTLAGAVGEYNNGATMTTTASVGNVSVAFGDNGTWAGNAVSAANNNVSSSSSSSSNAYAGSAYASVVSGGGGAGVHVGTLAGAVGELNNGASLTTTASVGNVSVAFGDSGTWAGNTVSVADNTANSSGNGNSNGQAGSAYASVVSGGGGAGVHVGTLAGAVCEFNNGGAMMNSTASVGNVSVAFGDNGAWTGNALSAANNAASSASSSSSSSSNSNGYAGSAYASVVSGGGGTGVHVGTLAGAVGEWNQQGSTMTTTASVGNVSVAFGDNGTWAGNAVSAANNNVSSSSSSSSNAYAGSAYASVVSGGGGAGVHVGTLAGAVGELNNGASLTTTASVGNVSVAFGDSGTWAGNTVSVADNTANSSGNGNSNGQAGSAYASVVSGGGGAGVHVGTLAGAVCEFNNGGAMMNSTASVGNVSVAFGDNGAWTGNALSAANNAASSASSSSSSSSNSNGYAGSAYASVVSGGGGTGVHVGTLAGAVGEWNQQGSTMTTTASVGNVSVAFGDNGTWAGNAVSAANNNVSSSSSSSSNAYAGSAYASVVSGGGGAGVHVGTLAGAVGELNQGTTMTTMASVGNVSVAFGDSGTWAGNTVSVADNTANSSGNGNSNGQAGSAYASVVSGGGGAGVHVGTLAGAVCEFNNGGAMMNSTASVGNVSVAFGDNGAWTGNALSAANNAASSASSSSSSSSNSNGYAGSAYASVVSGGGGTGVHVGTLAGAVGEWNQQGSTMTTTASVGNVSVAFGSNGAWAGNAVSAANNNVSSSSSSSSNAYAGSAYASVVSGGGGAGVHVGTLAGAVGELNQGTTMTTMASVGNVSVAFGDNGAWAGNAVWTVNNTASTSNCSNGGQVGSAYASVVVGGGGAGVHVGTLAGAVGELNQGATMTTTASVGNVSVAFGDNGTWTGNAVSAADSTASSSSSNSGIAGSAYASVVSGGGGAGVHVGTLAGAVGEVNIGAMTTTASVGNVSVALGDNGAWTGNAVWTVNNTVTATITSESNGAFVGSAYASVVSGGGGAGVHVGTLAGAVGELNDSGGMTTTASVANVSVALGDNGAWTGNAVSAAHNTANSSSSSSSSNFNSFAGSAYASVVSGGGGAGVHVGTLAGAVGEANNNQQGAMMTTASVGHVSVAFGDNGAWTGNALSAANNAASSASSSSSSSSNSNGYAGSAYASVVSGGGGTGVHVGTLAGAVGENNQGTTMTTTASVEDVSVAFGSYGTWANNAVSSSADLTFSSGHSVAVADGGGLSSSVCLACGAVSFRPGATAVVSVSLARAVALLGAHSFANNTVVMSHAPRATLVSSTGGAVGASVLATAAPIALDDGAQASIVVDAAAALDVASAALVAANNSVALVRSWARDAAAHVVGGGAASFQLAPLATGVTFAQALAVDFGHVNARGSTVVLDAASSAVACAGGAVFVDVARLAVLLSPVNVGVTGSLALDASSVLARGSATSVVGGAVAVALGQATTLARSAGAASISATVALGLRGMCNNAVDAADGAFGLVGGAALALLAATDAGSAVPVALTATIAIGDVSFNAAQLADGGASARLAGAVLVQLASTSTSQANVSASVRFEPGASSPAVMLGNSARVVNGTAPAVVGGALAFSVGTSLGRATVTVAGLTLANNTLALDGASSATLVAGAGIVAQTAVPASAQLESVFIVTNCTIRDGSIAVGAAASARAVAGGAIYAQVAAASNEQSFLALFGSQGNASQVVLANVSALGNAISAASAPNTTALGGAVYVESDGAQVRDSAFGGNRVDTPQLRARGGALYSPTTLRIERTNFTANFVSSARQSRGGGVAFDLQPARTATLVNCMFAGNRASVGGAIAALGSLDAVVALEGGAITGNSAAQDGGGVFASNVRLLANGTVFSLNNATVDGGGAYVGLADGAAELAGVVITGNAALASGGGIVVASTGLLALSASVVDSNSAGADGGGVSTSGAVNITACDFVGNRATTTGGALSSSAAALVVRDTTVRNNTATAGGSGIALSGSCNASVVGGALRGNGDAHTSGPGGAAFFVGGVSAVLERVSIDANAAQSGGGLALAGDARATLVSCNLTSNGALLAGGALQTNGTASASLQNVLIADNTAQSGDGGGVWHGSTGALAADLSTTIVNNTAARGGGVFVASAAWSAGATSVDWGGGASVTGNVAAGNDTAGANAPGGGGGVFWDLSGLAGVASVGDVLSLPRARVSGNAASAYGTDHASSAYRIGASAAVDGMPGVSQPVPVRVVDWFNETVASLSASSVVRCAGSACVSPLIDVDHGFANATLSQLGLPGDVDSVSLEVAALSSVPGASVADVSLSLTPCASGSGLQGDSCAPCPSGAYTFNGNFQCASCTVGLRCLGGTQVYAASGYWANLNASQIAEDGTAVVLQCPYDFCTRIQTVPCPDATTLTIANLQNANGSVCVDPAGTAPPALCRPGAHRNASWPLCGRCLANYTEWDQDCLRCAPGEFNAGPFFAQLGKMFALTALNYVVAQRSAEGASGFKQLVFLYQMSTLATYPSTVGGTVVALRPFALARQWLSESFSAFFGDDGACPFWIDETMNVWLGVLQPLVYFALVLVLFGLLHGVRALARLRSRSTRVQRRPACVKVLRVLDEGVTYAALARTCVVFGITLFEDVVETALAFSTCSAAAGVVYLYPGVTCTGIAFDSYAANLGGLIAVLALACGLPIAAGVYLLWRARSAPSERALVSALPSVRVYFAEYRRAFVWWESVMLLRRVLVLAVFLPVVVAPDGTSTAKLLLAFAVALMLVAQVLARPFRENAMNYLEVVSLAALLLVVAVNARAGIDAAGTQDAAIGTVVVLAVAGVALLAPLAVDLLRSARDLIRERVRAASREGGDRHESGVRHASVELMGTRSAKLDARLLEHDEST